MMKPVVVAGAVISLTADAPVATTFTRLLEAHNLIEMWYGVFTSA